MLEPGPRSLRRRKRPDPYPRNNVDVEIALTGQKEDDSKVRALRADFAALRDNPESIELVFFEAKHFSNPELRANGGQTPTIRNPQTLSGPHGLPRR